MKSQKFLWAIALSGLAMISTSCTTYSYTSRSAKINETTISSQAPNAEIEMDFTQKVTATSEPQVTKKDAMNEAVFLCLQKYKVDVVVDPIYEIRYDMLKKKAYTATVVGYAGFYKSVKSGIDAMIEKKVTREDIENYKLLNDPSFYPYKYAQPQAKGGDVTNYYINGNSSSAPAAPIVAASAAAMPQQSLGNGQKAKKQKQVAAVPSGEFNFYSGLINGPSDKRAWSFDFGYQRMAWRTENGVNEDGLHGFRFAIVANPTFKYGLGFKTGLNLDYAHGNMEVYRYSGWGTRDVDYVNFGVPAQISYRLEVVKNLSLFFYTGPVLNFHIYNGTDVCNENNCFAIAWGVGAGLQWKRLRFTLGGDYGIYELAGSSAYTNYPIQVMLGVVL